MTEDNERERQARYDKALDDFYAIYLAVEAEERAEKTGNFLRAAGVIDDVDAV